MPVVEAALFLLAAAWPLLRALDVDRRRPVAVGMVAAVVVVVTLLLVTGAMRWPLIPALVLVVAWEVLALRHALESTAEEGSGPGRRLAAVAVLVVLVLPAVALPVLVFPRVPPIVGQGPFPVGQRQVMVTVPSQSDSTGAHRSLAVWIWYPGEPEANLHRPPLDPELRALEPSLASTPGIPDIPWLMRGVTRVPAEIYSPMRLSTRNRDYPWVVLAHGRGGSPLLHRRLAVALASEGFVVVAPALADDLPVRLDAGTEPAAAVLAEWEADGRAVLEKVRALADPASGDSFAGRLQLARLGWVGQGLGGAVGRALSAVEGVQVLMIMDPVPGTGPPDEGLPELRLERTGAPTVAGSRLIRTAMPGIGPWDFGDLNRWSPLLLRRAGMGGRVPAKAAEAWVGRWATALLNVYLKGAPADSLSRMASRFPGTMISLP